MMGCAMSADPTELGRGEPWVVRFARANSDVSRESLMLVGHCSKLLHPSAADCLAREEITLRVHGYGMQERELARHVTRPTKPRQRLSVLAIKRPNNLVESVRDIHISLGLVQREMDPPGLSGARKGLLVFF